jgi:hypothetical protein
METLAKNAIRRVYERFNAMNVFQSRLFPVALTICVLSLGCGSGGITRYVPTSTTAKKTLETALETWKSGAVHGPITSSKPAINVFDARWQAGEKLDSYEIIEEVKGSEHPQFKVRLQLKGQPEEMLFYRVIGIDPLLVFRDADYKKTIGM